MIAALLALALSASPEHLRAGSGESAALSIACAQEPRIDPSAGAVRDLWSDGATWHASYDPPPSSVPRVALVGVLCGAEAALLPIAIWGSGDAEVHARPGSVVEVRIGEQVFGPLRTDKAGVARVRVTVPPGVDFAFQGSRAIPLHVPLTRTVHLVAAQDEVALDQARTVAVYAFAVDRRGLPLSDAPLRLTSSRGELSAAHLVSPGVYRSEWSLAAGAPGVATVEASVEGGPEPARVSLALVAGEPAQVDLVADSGELVAGEGPLHLRAVVRDAAGNSLAAPIKATASLGILRVSEAAPGTHDLEVSLPGAFGGAKELRVGVSAGHAAAEARIALKPAAPARVRIAASQAKALADGRTSVRVRVRAQDRFGNEVAQPPDATSSAGAVSTVAHTERGWEATWVAPVLHDPGSALVDVRSGPVAGTARIDLDPAVRPLAVALRAGVFSNFHEALAPLAGVVASLRTDWSGGQVGLQLAFDALGWSTSDVVQTSAGPRQLRTALGVFLPGLALEWRMPVSDRSVVWAQGGPLLAFASSQTHLAGNDPELARQTKPGFQAGAGAELRFWRGRALVELRWLLARSFAMANLQGRLEGLCLSAGYRVELF